MRLTTSYCLTSMVKLLIGLVKSMRLTTSYCLTSMVKLLIGLVKDIKLMALFNIEVEYTVKT
jgi:hypothetical protein